MVTASPDRIAYHPIRIGPHASLFLPISEQELEIYTHESVNPLRRTNHNNNNTTTTTTTTTTLLDNSSSHHHPQSRPSTSIQTIHNGSDSPPGYTTPSPLTLPTHPASSSSPSSPHPLAPVQHQLPPSSAIKRSHHSIITTEQADHHHYPSQSHRSMSPPAYRHPHSNEPPQPIDQAHKRTRYNPPPAHFAPSDPPDSVSQTVAQHYNSRPNLTKNARLESPIYALRKFNNWIKSVIIGKFGSADSEWMIRLLRSSSSSSHHQQQQQQLPGTKVLDLGCGKGGDLAKWQNAGVRELYGFDIASVSIQQAQSRYLQSCKNKFYAKFTALDCFSLPITSALTSEELSKPFHAVSLQFCMHYAFENEQKARMMLENVSKFLAKGGVMIGTIPDPDLLIARWREYSQEDSSDQPNFGNSIYQIRFPYRFPSSDRPDQESYLDQIFGNEYMFYLKDAVDDVPEYLVLWEPFVRLAQEYQLKLIYKNGFHRIFEEERSNSGNRTLLSRMNVIDADGNPSISSDQWDAAGIYLAFAFIKE